MDYDLEPFLDEKANETIKKINKDLDYFIDELFMGKKLSSEEINHDIELLNMIKNEYYDLLEYERKTLSEDATLLSKHSGRSFIIAYLSAIGIFITPLMSILSVMSFARAMKYYTSYKALSNTDIISEYLSTFDNILNRIINYDAVLKIRYNNILESENNNPLLLKK